MKKLFKRGNSGLLVLGISLMVYYRLSGSYIDEDGYLIEEFWAMGLGIFMVIASSAGFLIWGIVSLFGRIRS